MDNAQIIDKDYDFLMKSLNHSHKQSTEDKINHALLEHYPNCSPLFNDMWRNIHSLNEVNLQEVVSLLHSLKGHVRNIGFFQLGIMYHKLESICEFLKDENFPIRYDKVKSHIQELLDLIHFLHQSYLNGDYTPNIEQFQKNKSDNWNRNKYNQFDNGNLFQIKDKTVANILEKTMQNRMINQEFKQTTKQIITDFNDLKILLNNQSLTPDELLFQTNRFLSSLEKHFHKIETNLHKQDKNSNTIVDNMLKVRLVPISHYSESFYETVRLASVHQQKKCELEIVGEHIQVDKSVMDSLSFAISHILRNAVVHGIENEAQRISAGKPQLGKITIQFNQVSHFLSLSIKDDGAGIDIDKIQTMVKQKWPDLNTQKYNKQEWFNFIFNSGFTTRDLIDEFSGRGVGLESVRSTLLDLNGQILVDSQKGNGTTFTINLPINQFISNMVIVQNNEELFAIPEYLIDTMLMVHHDYYQEHLHNKEFINLAQLLKHYANEQVDMPEYHKVSSIQLHKLINAPIVSSQKQIKYTIIVLNYLGDKLVLITNDIYTRMEAMIENIGSLQNTNGILGAIVVNNHQTALVINPVLLMNNFDKELRQNTTQSNNTSHYVLIVDDSKVACVTTQHSLKKMHFQSISKEDGQLAYDYLCSNLDNLPSVILTDYEMPNVNGMELSKMIMNNPNLKHIPIIMITSKSLEHYQSDAQKIGIKKLFAKPFNESELQIILNQLMK